MPHILPRAFDISAWHDQALARPQWPHEALDALTPSWPAGDATAGHEFKHELWRWIATNHQHNSALWAEEDLARRTQVQAEAIAANKRAIDRHNQARNDATERVDELLLMALNLVDAKSVRSDAPQSRVQSGARLNSETAGSMIDRLSILALKVHAMRAQLSRSDADTAHLQAAKAKLERLLEQRQDLGRCLDELLLDAAAGRAYFKVYRQFKMYNDPRFNPVLVAEAAALKDGRA